MFSLQQKKITNKAFVKGAHREGEFLKLEISDFSIDSDLYSVKINNTLVYISLNGDNLIYTYFGVFICGNVEEIVEILEFQESLRDF